MTGKAERRIARSKFVSICRISISLLSKFLVSLNTIVKREQTRNWHSDDGHFLLFIVMKKNIGDIEKLEFYFVTHMETFVDGQSATKSSSDSSNDERTT